MTEGGTGEIRDTRCLVALSGRMGSAVAAALLKTQGVKLEAVFFRRKSMPTRCSNSSFEGAQAIAQKLDIPLTVVDVQEAFEDRVLDRFVHERVALRDLDPCIPCVQNVTFAYLFALADEMRCPRVATGHFLQVVESAGTGIFRVLKCVEPAVDQSYYLFGLRQAEISRLLTPLGGLSRNQVAKMATELGLASAMEPNPIRSGACLNCDPGLHDWIKARVAPLLRQPGMVRMVDGNIVGQHEGLLGFRLGDVSRIALNAESSEELRVVEFDRASGSLILGTEEKLLHRTALLDHLNWIGALDGLREVQCQARAGFAATEGAALVTFFENGSAHVDFKNPQKTLFPGVAVAFYRESELLGGGWIEKTLL